MSGPRNPFICAVAALAAIPRDPIKDGTGTPAVSGRREATTCPAWRGDPGLAASFGRLGKGNVGRKARPSASLFETQTVVASPRSRLLGARSHHLAGSRQRSDRDAYDPCPKPSTHGDAYLRSNKPSLDANQSGTRRGHVQLLCVRGPLLVRFMTAPSTPQPTKDQLSLSIPLRRPRPKFQRLSPASHQPHARPAHQAGTPWS